MFVLQLPAIAVGCRRSRRRGGKSCNLRVWDPSGAGGPATHVDFRRFYWEFEDNRPMYLLFNNFGYEQDASRAVGAWAGHPQPVPLAFFFNSKDAVPVLEPQGANIVLMCMRIPIAALLRSTDGNPATVPVPFDPVVAATKMNCTLHPATGVMYRNVRFQDGNAARAANAEFGDWLYSKPPMCLFVPGSRHAEEFMDNNYEDVLEESKSRGLVHRVRNKISQHLCAPILNPDTRLGCIAPLNHDTRHLPPEMRDFALLMNDVNFDFLEATSPPLLGNIVLSEFNGGTQDVAASESLLYLPNFHEYTTSVLADSTFTLDCYSSTGVPAFLCLFCRDGPVVGTQPRIVQLSLQNRSTMKKSDTVFETDAHELFHMTQRNVHNRSEYESTAFNKRQTILLATEDIGIMGMDPVDNYQQQKRCIIRVSGKVAPEPSGIVTVLFVYNNRGLYLTGVQQSVVRL